MSGWDYFWLFICATGLFILVGRDLERRGNKYFLGEDGNDYF